MRRCESSHSMAASVSSGADPYSMVSKISRTLFMRVRFRHLKFRVQGVSSAARVAGMFISGPGDYSRQKRDRRRTVRAVVRCHLTGWMHRFETILARANPVPVLPSAGSTNYEPLVHDESRLPP